MGPDAVALRAQLEKLLAEHGAGVRRVARAYAAAPAEAADLAQEIAIALWRALPSFRGECSERTFVYRIAHNRGLTHAVARRTRERLAPLVAATPLADDPPSADERLDAARRREALMTAIASMPVGARAVLMLALEGLSHGEIASVLGSSENSIAVRLSRARHELRDRLGGKP